MTVKEFKDIYYDDVIIYTSAGDETLEFEDLYKGGMKNTPENLLGLKVGCIGAKRKGVIDLEVII